MGVDLPSDFREFLLEYNGGTPNPNEFVCSQGVPEGNSCVRHFYKVRGKGSIEWDLRHFSDGMPPDLLGIGCDPFGKRICIGLKGERRGSVFFWDHEGYELLGSDEPIHDVYRLADSFAEFLEGLHETVTDCFREIISVYWEDSVSAREMVGIRKLVPELGALSISQLKEKLSDMAELVIEDGIVVEGMNVELIRRIESLGLRCRVERCEL